MGFLDGIFETKAARKQKAVNATAAIGRATQGGSYDTWNHVVTATPNKWDLDGAVTKGYERVIWVFRCVHVIASAQASVPMQLKDYSSPNGHIVDNKQIQKILNRKSNPYEDAWAFRYRLSGQLLLSTKGAFIELVRSASGEVQHMYLLHPDNIEPIPDTRTWISGYKVKRADGQREEVLKPEQVMWLRTQPHMLDPYRQMTPLMAAGLAAETDFLARMFNRNFLKNDGRPGMLISINGDLSAEDGMEIKNKFDGGYSQAGQTTVIEAEGIDVVDMSARPRDAQWNEAIQGSKDDILLAFGCPESVLGNASGRCLRASELVHLASGEAQRAEQLVGTKFKLLQPSKDGSVVVDAFAEYARKEKIYKITTFSGRTLQTNGEHPLFMGLSTSKGPFKRDIFPFGWTSMEDIAKNHRKNTHHSATEVAVPVIFAQTSGETYDSEDVRAVAEEFLRIPEELFTASVDTQTTFISTLYSNHGRFSQHTSFDIFPPTYEFAVSLQRLLLRIGVHSSVSTRKLNHVVTISGKINMFNFLEFINLSGNAAEKATAVRNRLTTDKGREHNSFRSDGLPPGLIWDRVLSVEELGEDQTVALTVGSPTAPEQDHSYLGLFWEHNTFNNAETEEGTWWTGTMKTHCDAIARGMEPLTGSDNDELYIEYDYTTVDVLQRIERRKHDKVAQDLARGVITIDDYRIAIGKPPLNIPATRVLIHPTRMVAGVDPSDVEAVKLLPILGAPAGGGGIPANPFAQPTSPDGIVGGVNDFQNAELSANDTGDAPQTVNDIAARTMRSADDTGRSPNDANPNAIVEISERIDALLSKEFQPVEKSDLIDFNSPQYYDVKGYLQGSLEGILSTWSTRQLEVAKTRMTHTKVRKGTRHWEGEGVVTKNLDTSYIVEKDEWLREVSQPVINVIKKGLAEFDPDNKFTDDIDRIASKIASEVIQSADLQTELLTTHISVMDVSGKSVQEIDGTLNSESFDRPSWIIDLASKAVHRAIVSMDGVISSFVDEVETKSIKFVRTVSGVRRYGLEKGSIIVRDGSKPLDGLVAMTNDLPGYEKVADLTGKVYYVGKENGIFVVRDPLDNSKLYENTDEQTAFQWLNSKVGGSSPSGTPTSGDAFDRSGSRKPNDSDVREGARRSLTDPKNNFNLTPLQASAADALNDERLKVYLRMRQRGYDHIRALNAAQGKK